MRTLNFIVDGQIIKKDPNCDFRNLVPGTEGYLKANFQFSPEWEPMKKVAAFWSSTGKEYPPQLLNDDGTCMIPDEALRKYAFKISIIGKADKIKIQTNKIIVKQDGGK